MAGRLAFKSHGRHVGVVTGILRHYTPVKLGQSRITRHPFFVEQTALPGP
jgi:hypothetical protein